MPFKDNIVRGNAFAIDDKAAVVAAAVITIVYFFTFRIPLCM